MKKHKALAIRGYSYDHHYINHGYYIIMIGYVYINSSATTPVKAFVSSLSSRTVTLRLWEGIEKKTRDDNRKSRDESREDEGSTRLRIQSQSSSSLPLRLYLITGYPTRPA